MFRVGEALRQTVEPEIHNRRGVKRKQLADQQAADDGDAQRVAQLRSRAAAQRQRQAAQQRRHGGHHDGTETQQASLKDRFFRRLVLHPLRFEREVDHHDGVLLHDADQKNDADQRHHSQIVAGQKQREDGAHARRRQRGKNR